MKDNFPEAGAIVFTTIKTPEGFTWNVTFRDVDGKAIVKRIIGFQTYCSKNEWKAVEPKSFGAKKEVEYVEGKVCPLDGGRLVKKISKLGKEYHACQNGRYDFTTKTTMGCQFVDWLTPKIEYDRKTPYSGETIPVEQYDK